MKSTNYEAPHYAAPVASSLIGTNIPLSALFSVFALMW
jgi:hypothetical protein